MVAPLQHPRERITSLREPVQPEDLAPLKVLQRGATYLVYDPALPPGQRTASEHASYQDALAAARARKAGPR
ncbi:MAG TPA: hypothetical protein VF765_31215 [Polyangiaceae bacterium]